MDNRSKNHCLDYPDRRDNKNHSLLQFDPAHVEAITQEFSLMQTHIDRAQETALKDNHTGALDELRAAESKLSTIIQILPSSQE